MEVSANDPSARSSELRRGWPLLAASVLGGAFLGVPLYATGVLIPIWEKEFGWTRGAMGLALSLFNLSLILVLPVVGRCVVRFGVRKPTLLSLALLVPAYLIISQVGPDVWTLYAAYLLYPAVGAGAAAITFMSSINQHFSRHRGLAMAIVCSATTLCMMATPPIVNWVVSNGYDWRTAWLVFAVGAALVWPVVYFGLQEIDYGGAAVVSQNKSSERPVQQFEFRLLGLIFFLMAFAATSIMLQIVPLARSLGFSQDMAVLSATVFAGGLGTSRLLTGLLLDRVFAPYVLQGVVFSGIGGCLLIAFGSSELLFAGAFFIGAAVGAETDILSYLAARYFSPQTYARAYSMLYSVMLTGVVISPAVAGMSYDIFHSYMPLLGTTICVFFITIPLIHRLPKYRF